MRGLFEGWHFIILLVVVLLLFGAKRMPDAARSLGRSMRIFKSEVESMRDDDDRKSNTSGSNSPSSSSGSGGSSAQPITGRVVDDAGERQQSEPTGDERR